MPRTGLDAIFSPSSIAIVGASRHRGKIGYEILHNLIVNEFQGTVYPVNPKATSIHGIRAYPSVLEIPDRVDLAVITVPAEVALEAVEDCGKKGVTGLVVITAGFREIGEVGMAREARLLAVCDAYDMTMIGPNCMGVTTPTPTSAWMRRSRRRRRSLAGSRWPHRAAPSASPSWTTRNPWASASRSSARWGTRPR